MNCLRHQNYKNENTETKKPLYDWLINYILELIKENGAGVKDKIMSLVKINTTENYSKPTRVNNMYGSCDELRKPKIKKQSENNIIKALRTE